MSDLTKHIYAIKNIANRGPVSDDFNYSDRFIAHLLKVSRNRLLKQKLDKYDSVSPDAYQDLCITLERGQLSDCPGLPQTSCFLLKSTIDIPEVLESKWGTTAKPMYVDGRSLSHYNLVNKEYKSYSLLNSIKNLKDKWLIYNRKLFVLSEDQYLKKLLFPAIFTDPEFVFYSELSTCPEAGDSVDFPIDAELVEPMYELVLKTLGISLQFPRDDENNAKNIEASQADSIN